MTIYSRLDVEINRQLDELSEAGMKWVPAFVAAAIIGAHKGGLSDLASCREDALFYEGCSREFVRNRVREVINVRAGDKKEPGGDDKVATACEISRDALRKWRDSGRVPSKHWSVVATLAQATLDEVAATKLKKRARAA